MLISFSKYSGREKLLLRTATSVKITALQTTDISKGAGSIENQEYQLYLLAEISQKSEGILTELNRTIPSININNITHPATLNTTLLQRVLAKITTVLESSNH